MSAQELPGRPSLEYLKKLAKDRASALRRTDPAARLADAQLAIAREHGFPSWRALKAEVDRRRAPQIAAFFQACESGDVAALRQLLTDEPGLVRARDARGRTGLHSAVRQAGVVRLLLEHGADPNARDADDNAAPLHMAAGEGRLESVRALLDAGAEVNGAGDVHKGGVIGWAAARDGNDAVIALLLERGARHHIFSAIALGDLGLVERLVDEDPGCLSHRRSRYEQGQTPLHAAIAPPDGIAGSAAQLAIVERLIALGADVEATDGKGRTPLAIARLRGARDVARLLEAAGATVPQSRAPAGDEAPAGAITRSAPMFLVGDMRATIAWYESIGFHVHERYEDDGEVMFARLTFGEGELALSPGATSGLRDVSLWFFTDDIEPLYRLLKARQLRAGDVAFAEDLYEPFYGGRQFSVRDPNGLTLVFHEPPRR